MVFGQRSQLWWDLPLRDSFDLLRWVYRVPAERHRANLAAFVDLLELGPLLDTPVRQLSLGQRMRGEITAALLFGDAYPAGKLPITFPASQSDGLANTPERYPGVDGKVFYDEELQVGYRWFQSQGIPPPFPFGFGLSYTNFE